MQISESPQQSVCGLQSLLRYWVSFRGSLDRLAQEFHCSNSPWPCGSVVECLGPSIEYSRKRLQPRQHLLMEDVCTNSQQSRSRPMIVDSQTVTIRCQTVSCTSTKGVFESRCLSLRMIEKRLSIICRASSGLCLRWPLSNTGSQVSLDYQLIKSQTDCHPMERPRYGEVS